MKLCPLINIPFVVAGCGSDNGVSVQWTDAVDQFTSDQTTSETDRAGNDTDSLLSSVPEDTPFIVGLPSVGQFVFEKLS